MNHHSWQSAESGEADIKHWVQHYIYFEQFVHRAQQCHCAWFAECASGWLVTTSLTHWSHDVHMFWRSYLQDGMQNRTTHFVQWVQLDEHFANMLWSTCCVLHFVRTHIGNSNSESNMYITSRKNTPLKSRMLNTHHDMPPMRCNIWKHTWWQIGRMEPNIPATHWEIALRKPNVLRTHCEMRLLKSSASETHYKWCISNSTC